VSTAQSIWADARRQLDGLAGGGLNIAHEAVLRPAAADPDRVAIRWLGAGGERVDIRRAALRDQVLRFASVLAGLGVARGDRVFALAGRIPELYVTALGTLAHGAVFSPLFSAFGPDPVAARLGPGGGRVLVTTASLYQRKVAPVRDRLPDLEHVLIAGAGPAPERTRLLAPLLLAATPAPAVAPTAEEDPALLHFTSGTTGRPKGAVHVHQAVVAHHATGRLALDLRDGDRFWCTADPGWVTGTSYGIIAPLTAGATLVVDEGEFEPERWYRILAEERITVWYTAPTAIRMLMRAGASLARGHDLGALRFAASVGEALNPEAVLWGREAIGMPFHDNWWQTETGGILIANVPGMEVRPGSMGKPLPGVDACVVRRERGGAVTRIDEPGVVGELALRRGWPSMFRAYLGEEERYRACFAGELYLSGDLVRRDADGYYWFVGRADDVIKSAGHLIGPFEVESALLEHHAVAEAGVIGVPDPLAGELVKAFVALKPGFTAGDELRQALHAHARRRLGPAVAPRSIDFVATLPRTRSGKIMRRLLRARELGLPEGDLSTLEAAP
jgi:acetyl-CoA synthetase